MKMKAPIIPITRLTEEREREREKMNTKRIADIIDMLVHLFRLIQVFNTTGYTRTIETHSC